MQVTIRLRNSEASSDVRSAIERRVRFGLGRFGGRIQRTDDVLDDVNGPRGGSDQRCTVRVQTPAAPPIVIEVTDVESLAAVDRALDRAARHLRDKLNRRRDLQRGSRPMLLGDG